MAQRGISSSDDANRLSRLAAITEIPRRKGRNATDFTVDKIDLLKVLCGLPVRGVPSESCVQFVTEALKVFQRGTLSTRPGLNPRVQSDGGSPWQWKNARQQT